MGLFNSDLFNSDLFNTSTNSGASAELAEGAGAAFDAGGSVEAHAGLASGTGVAQTPQASVQPGAGLAAGAGEAFDAPMAYAGAGLARGIGRAFMPLGSIDPGPGLEGDVSDLTDWRIKILGYDFTRKCEWGVSIEEALGSPASATFVLQDRAAPGLYPFPDVGNGIGFEFDRADVMVYLVGQPVPLFRGRVMNVKGSLPVGMPWVKYAFTCSDYQEEVFSRRLIGVPDGYSWSESAPDDEGNIEFTPTDSYDGKDMGGTDASIIDRFMDLVQISGTRPESTLLVGTYTESVFELTPGNQFDRADLRALFELLAGLYEGGNIQYWMDTLFRIHFVVLPRWWEDALDPLLEAAPADIDNDTPNPSAGSGPPILRGSAHSEAVSLSWSERASGSIGSRGLDWTFDYGQGLGSGGEYYVSGGLGFEYNFGAVRFHGTGWDVDGVPTALPPSRSPSLSQAVINEDTSITAEGRASAARRARRQTARGILRGSLTVGNERHHPDGWHPGQHMGISDVRLPLSLNGRRFIIQRVNMRLIPFTNWRIYDLDWGDAPIGRNSTRRLNKALQTKTDPPGRIWDIAGRKLSPLPGSVETIVGQLVTDDGKPKRVPNVRVCLELKVWDETGTPVAPGAAYLSAADVTTDAMGRWQVDVQFGPDPGWSYQVNPVDC